ncbi:MAG: septum site-determining protein MinC [Methylobacterium frigidaeris]
MTSISPTRPSLPLRGRSFRALVLAPEMPLGDWFANLDALLARSPTLFAERAVILDLNGLTPPPAAPEPVSTAPDGPEAGSSPTPADASAVAATSETPAPAGDAAPTEQAAPSEVPAEAAAPAVAGPDLPATAGPDLTALLGELGRRGIRIMGIEKADPSWLVPGLPPLLAGGRPADATTVPVPAAPEKRRPSSLVLDTPVRSGQCIYHPEGDVTVMGSVASGAEILAGGSIHVYGALRGRAIAGAGGNPRARIYCRRFQPELLGIDGLFRTADSTDPKLRDKPVQVWLESDALRMAPLD